ncbi:MAG TPA: radical SAM protein [Vicinamibacterales bacterium]|nr:radical SAM protein [Acidobacteriota bacterium]HOC19196.1 radical SAM protein [Vicinamibacterales bacterium]
MLPLHEGLVYGPVRSRRLGRSLGLNILPRQQKVCTFNCSYCQYGWTAVTVDPGTSPGGPWPSPAAIARAAARALAALAARHEPIDRLTVAGNGEPTLHPELPAVIAALREARDEVVPRLPIAILSNASTLGLPGVSAALETLDERYMKLDAGDPALLRRLNAARVPLESIVSGLAGLRDVVIQAMFVKDRTGRFDNATDLAVSAWIVQLLAARPRLVHVYSVDRPTAWPYLQAVPLERLEEIANCVRAAGLEATAFGTPAHGAARRAAG